MQQELYRPVIRNLYHASICNRMAQNRIRKLREERGWTQQQLANASGFSQPEIARWEKSVRPIHDVNLHKIAGALGCKTYELLDESPMDLRENRVPVVGIVGAGAHVFPIDDNAKGQGIDTVECPANINPGKGVALEVRGDSMEPMISEGFLLFYETRLPGVPVEFLNRICVVWIEGDGCLVKKVRKGSMPGYYTLDSLNPKEPPAVGL